MALLTIIRRPLDDPEQAQFRVGGITLDIASARVGNAAGQVMTYVAANGSTPPKLVLADVPTQGFYAISGGTSDVTLFHSSARI